MRHFLTVYKLSTKFTISINFFIEKIVSLMRSTTTVVGNSQYMRTGENYINVLFSFIFSRYSSLFVNN